jgi:RimJ/RimL family protein N-acetyltransferase
VTEIDPRPTGFRLRAAELADADVLFGWANDPATRAASFGRAEVPWDAHVSWLTAVLRDPDRRLWIGLEGDVPVGQVRVDRTTEGVGVVSIGLAAVARGHGVGGSLLRAGLAAATSELGIRRARAVVLADNLPSRRLFERAGFTVVVGAGIPGHPDGLVLEASLGAGSESGPAR